MRCAFPPYGLLHLKDLSLTITDLTDLSLTLKDLTDLTAPKGPFFVVQ